MQEKQKKKRKDEKKNMQNRKKNEKICEHGLFESTLKSC